MELWVRTLWAFHPTCETSVANKNLMFRLAKDHCWGFIWSWVRIPTMDIIGSNGGVSGLFWSGLVSHLCHNGALCQILYWTESLLLLLLFCCLPNDLDNFCIVQTWCLTLKFLDHWWVLYCPWRGIPIFESPTSSVRLHINVQPIYNWNIVECDKCTIHGHKKGHWWVFNI